ncbi:MAG: hypothetical protein IT447_05325 [Phycisphaerales bacterium]|jgi:hypothetical protein|nr:hypothetical protein [Phycisphaerales bacterium]
MILAGIDEAGYGPLLGPLVVGCCAFELPGEPADELPCLWHALRGVVSKNRLKSGRRLHVNDSKLVYSSSGGLKELERSVLSIFAATVDWCDGLDDFLHHIAPDITTELRTYPWYQPPADERFPLEQESAPIRIFANAARDEMRRGGIRCASLRAQIIPERRLNQMVEQTRNKGSMLFSIVARHLDYLLRTFGRQGLVIFCDRQGGREHYGRLLRLMFEDWSLQIVREQDGYAEYQLSQSGQTVRLIFAEKAETRSLSVALASMLSKYLREALMSRFNAYWRRLLPDLQPTAGYYTDGSRFLRDIESSRRELGIADDQLIRSR